MKRSTILIFIILSFSCLLLCHVDTKVVTLKGSGPDPVFSVFCCPGQYTVFEIPVGEHTVDCIVSQKSIWECEKYGSFIRVKPQLSGQDSSFSIITRGVDGEKVYLFLLSCKKKVDSDTTPCEPFVKIITY